MSLVYDEKDLMLLNYLDEKVEGSPAQESMILFFEELEKLKANFLLLVTKTVGELFIRNTAAFELDMLLYVCPYPYSCKKSK